MEVRRVVVPEQSHDWSHRGALDCSRTLSFAERGFGHNSAVPVFGLVRNSCKRVSTTLPFRSLEANWIMRVKGSRPENAYHCGDAN